MTSIYDGCRLSFADTRKFRHGDMQDLERQLQRSMGDDVRGRLIIVDGVFSMMGEVAELEAIVELARKYEARLLVDEAHSVGVIGKGGRGVGEHFHVNRADVDMWMGTLSKSFASCGGYIAGSLMLTNLSTEQLVGLNGAAFNDGLCVMAWEVIAALSLGLARRAQPQP